MTDHGPHRASPRGGEVDKVFIEQVCKAERLTKVPAKQVLKSQDGDPSPAPRVHADRDKTRPRLRPDIRTTDQGRAEGSLSTWIHLLKYDLGRTPTASRDQSTLFYIEDLNTGVSTMTQITDSTHQIHHTGCTPTHAGE